MVVAIVFLALSVTNAHVVSFTEDFLFFYLFEAVHALLTQSSSVGEGTDARTILKLGGRVRVT